MRKLSPIEAHEIAIYLADELFPMDVEKRRRYVKQMKKRLEEGKV